MSDEDQNEFFFLCELNDEDPEVSSQDKNNIELIEEAEVKDCNDEKKKGKKRKILEFNKNLMILKKMKIKMKMKIRMILILI